MDKHRFVKLRINRMMLITFVIAMVTVFGWIDPVQCAADIGFAKIVTNKVYGNSLSKKVRPGDRLFHNQRIRTSLDSGVDIRFLDASILYVGELSDLTLDNMIYNINKKTGTGALQIVKGVMRFVSGAAPNLNFTVKTANSTLGIRGATFDLMATSGETEVAVREGAIQVNFPSGSKQVVTGQVFSIPKIGEAGFESSISVKMKKSVSKMLRMLEVSPADASKITVKKKNAKQKEDPALKQSPAENNATIGKNLHNILYMDLSYGRVIIEMMPNLAPNHIKRIKQLVREKFYDGHKFHNVISGFVAETGDPTGTGIGGSGTKLRAEISGTRFTRGLVGMKRDRNNPDSADSQFFILLGDAMHLDGKYTAWGRVIHGMLLMDRMRTGSPPMKPDYIVRMRIASDRGR